jgi:hypothetical protein
MEINSESEDQMTAIGRTPENTNFLQQTKYTLTFPRLNNVTYFMQELNMPGLSINELPRNTPFIDLYVPGNKLSYDTFKVTFIIDEELRAYQDVHDWIRGVTDAKNFDEYTRLGRLAEKATGMLPKQPQYADGIATIYSALNNPKIRLHFKNMFPTSISAINFTTTDTEVITLTADVTFRFDYFDIERL